MSMYARQQSDEETDEDDMDDEELIRLVDQTNEDSNSLSDEPITVEEKILVETRGHAVGSSASESQSSVYTGHGEPDEMFKLVLAGNAAVGKSSFIIRLCKGKFYSALNATLGRKQDFKCFRDFKGENYNTSKATMERWFQIITFSAFIFYKTQLKLHSQFSR